MSISPVQVSSEYAYICEKTERSAVQTLFYGNRPRDRAERVQDAAPLTTRSPPVLVVHRRSAYGDPTRLNVSGVISAEGPGETPDAEVLLRVSQSPGFRTFDIYAVYHYVDL